MSSNAKQIISASAPPRFRGEKLYAALMLTLLIAAAGPLSITVRLVRADAQTADYRLVFSGEWMDAAQQTSKHEKSSPEKKPAPVLQALSGYWDTAAAFQAPSGEVSAAPLIIALRHSVVVTPLFRVCPITKSPPSFFASTRAPPRA